jgi:hypothetical protein
MESQDTLNMKKRNQRITTIEHIQKWKDTGRHPISNVDVVVSISPKSEYVKLYKESIKILVKDFDKHILSIEECERIRNNLPSVHTIVNKRSNFYDHLFIKYFINNKNYDCAHEYIAYGTDMFLYLNLYKSIKRKQYTLTNLQLLSHSSSFEKEYQTTEDLLRYNICEDSFSKGYLSISKIMENLCEDITIILHLNIKPLTIENYDKVSKNMKVLQFVYDIYKIPGFDNITKDITIRSFDKNILYIYNSIVANNSPIFLLNLYKLLNIYKKIILLYKYCIPYDYIYINSSNCKNDYDTLSLEKLDDLYTYDTGEVSIIPYFKYTKLKDNINEYVCFITDELYRYIKIKIKNNYEISLINIKNPKTREILTLHDIIYVYKNKIKLIERSLKEHQHKFNIILKESKNLESKELKSKKIELEGLELEKIDITNIINSLILYNEEYICDVENKMLKEFKNEFNGLFKLSRGKNNVVNESLNYLYLTINLGTENSPIHLNIITSKDATDITDKESSRAITYPIFKSKIFNGKINQLLSQIVDDVPLPKDGSFNYLIDIPNDADILMKYKEKLENNIKNKSHHILGKSFSCK